MNMFPLQNSLRAGGALYELVAVLEIDRGGCARVCKQRQEAGHPLSQFRQRYRKRGTYGKLWRGVRVILRFGVNQQAGHTRESCGTSTGPLHMTVLKVALGGRGRA